MTDSKELMPGDTKKYEIGGSTLTLEPMPFGRLKKLMKIIQDALAELTDKKDNQLIALQEVLDKRFDDIFPLMFNSEKHTFLNRQWVDDNLTIPMLSDIVKSWVQINGLKDFFTPMMARRVPPAVVPRSESNEAIH